MLNVNDVTEVGYIGKKGVTLKFSKGTGNALATFNLAVPKESYGKDKSDKKEYNYFSVVCFKQTAEFLANNSDKIKSVLVQGSLQSGSYKKTIGGEEITIYTVDIIANRVQVVEWNNTTTEAADTSNNSDGMTEVDDNNDIPF